MARDEDIGGARLIPAHAGKTTLWSTPGRCAGAHPRSRGENRGGAQVETRAAGSSPLTRGKLQHGRVGHDGGGLIPAHAGKTAVLDADREELGAHPRSRGENGRGIRRCRRGVGSSPLTRGKPSVKGAKAVMAGLIPAHAGKTVETLPVLRVSPAHPRSRGENHVELRAYFSARGSSPLTRGKRGRRRR